MNNQKLKEAASDELTHAASILEMIVNDNVTPNTHMFNAIESVVGNINRAKGSIGNITIENKGLIGSTPITESESLEGAINTVLSTLNIAIDLKVDEESGSLKCQYDSIFRLLLSARMSMEVIYQKVSTQ
ncbi:TPA: hypothetical protein RG501_RS06235 [Providencia rettgeri]|uniref:hypothetical protein n=1 Tax=Providencia rettgeri TaxID=587 RepID=UPI001B3986D7|nr:hypothetical protein [Providencia rettgeri]MBQ0306892.1 hypothetical protein [Providencia rettgeri]HEC8323459.1 hypothetical protein [Providencia rettgeri]HEM7186398.1 hypothetical protein [Providencia rettgeri]